MDDHDKNIRLAEELAEIAMRLQLSFLVELSSEVQNRNISIQSYTLLGFLKENPGITMYDLALLMGLTKHAIGSLVDNLSHSGLVKRLSNSKYRRSEVGITEKGRELIEGLQCGIVQGVQDIFRDIDPEDIERWVRVYRTLTISRQRNHELALANVFSAKAVMKPRRQRKLDSKTVDAQS